MDTNLSKSAEQNSCPDRNLVFSLAYSSVDCIKRKFTGVKFMKRHIILTLVILTFVTINYGQGTATPTATPAATTKVKAKRGPVFRPSKDQIMQAQTMLKTKSLYAGEATGKLNDETRTAIKSVQKDAGLRETGTLNRATLEKMGIELTDKQKAIPVTQSSLTPMAPKEKKPKAPKTMTTPAASTPSDGPKRPAPFSANKDQIMTLQKMLKDAKLFSGDAMGERSDELKEAVKKYQEANDLKVTGGINAATLEKMGIALTDKQKANVAAQAAYDAAKKN